LWQSHSLHYQNLPGQFQQNLIIIPGDNFAIT
jgi:hypothetical protein